MAAKAATKSAMYQELSTATGLTRKQVGCVLDECVELIENQLGKVVSVHPELGREPGNIADARLQVVADDLAADAFFFQRLLPNVRLGGVWGRGDADNVPRIFCEHGSSLRRKAEGVRRETSIC